MAAWYDTHVDTSRKKGMRVAHLLCCAAPRVHRLVLSLTPTSTISPWVVVPVALLESRRLYPAVPLPNPWTQVREISGWAMSSYDRGLFTFSFEFMYLLCPAYFSPFRVYECSATVELEHVSLPLRRFFFLLGAGADCLLDSDSDSAPSPPQASPPEEDIELA